MGKVLDTAIIYRNYYEKPDKKLIIKLKNYCKKKGNKFLLSNNIKLAISLNLDGAYIPSFNTDMKHLSYSYKKNFIFAGSAHNIYEVKTKSLQKVELIFLSSIFKKNQNYLGVNKFRIFSILNNRKFIALGGITNSNIKRLGLINCLGFAGISFFE